MMDEAQRAKRREATAALGDPSHFGSGFHSCLRRGMDSPLASHLHNLIGMLDDGIWAKFAAHAGAAIAEEHELDAGLLRAACLSWDPAAAYPKGGDRVDVARTLMSGLNLLSPSDWSGITEYLLTAGDPWNQEWAERARVRNRASQLAGLTVLELAPHILITSFRDRDGEAPVGRIEVRTETSEPDETGRRRQVILGWRPHIDGLAPIEMPSKDGFPTFDEAYAAAIRHAVGLLALRTDYNKSRRRSAHDPEWAAERVPAMERVCRHLVSVTEPGRYEGFLVRRAMYGLEYARTAYNRARNRTDAHPEVPDRIDVLPVGERIEAYLRKEASDRAATGPYGFLLHLALYGEKAALRRAAATQGYHWMGQREAPWRSPEEILAAWNSPEGLPPGPHPVPDAAPAAPCAS